MTEPLSTVCDHCDAKLKLKNPDLEGKKVKCPKCGEMFVAVAAGGGTKPASKKPAKKKSSDDDEMGFMDVDPDDYGPPPDEDDDDGEDYDSPKGRRSAAPRRGKKKSKSKKSKGGGAANVLKVVAIILVVAAVLGGGGFAVMTLVAGDGSSDIDWLPTDVEGYVKVDVDNLWNANVFQGIRNSANGKKFVEEMTKNTGVGPEDIDVMTTSIAKSGSADSQTMVIRSKKPLDLSAMQSTAPGSTQATHMGATYMKSAGGKIAVYLPDPQTLVRGPEAKVQALIERGKKNPSASKFSFASGCWDHVVIAAADSPSATSSSLGGMTPVPFISGQNAESFVVRINATSDIRLTALGRFKSAENAKTNVDKMNADIAKGKTQLAQTKSQLQTMPANPLVKLDQMMKLMNGAEQVLNSLQITQSGANANFQMTVSAQLINDFTELANSAPAASPFGFPSPFGK